MITVNDPSTRKSREAYWQRTLNTIFPDGLNNIPTRQNSIFENLNIIQHLDLAIFWNLYSLSIMNNSPSLVPSHYWDVLDDRPGLER